MTLIKGTLRLLTHNERSLSHSLQQVAQLTLGIFFKQSGATGGTEGVERLHPSRADGREIDFTTIERENNIKSLLVETFKALRSSITKSLIY